MIKDFSILFLKRKIILNQSSGIEETGTLVWQLVLALFVTYFIVYLMLVKGVAVSLKNLGNNIKN